MSLKTTKKHQGYFKEILCSSSSFLSVVQGSVTEETKNQYKNYLRSNIRTEPSPPTEANVSRLLLERLNAMS